MWPAGGALRGGDASRKCRREFACEGEGRTGFRAWDRASFPLRIARTSQLLASWP